MELNTTNTDLNKELKLKYSKLSSLRRSILAVEDDIRNLHTVKAKNSGQPPIKLKDEELIYLIERTLDSMSPSTRAFAECSNYFGKPQIWSNKVIRYRPLSSQVQRVLRELDIMRNSHLLLINKYDLLNMKELLACAEIRGFLNKLKRCLSFAKKLEANDTEIFNLKYNVKKLTEEIAKKNNLIKQIHLIEPKKRVKQLRREYPQMSVTEISQIVGISRTTVYKYLA
jgi:hypothetical protein